MTAGFSAVPVPAAAPALTPVLAVAPCAVPVPVAAAAFAVPDAVVAAAAFRAVPAADARIAVTLAAVVIPGCLAAPVPVARAVVTDVAVVTDGDRAAPVPVASTAVTDAVVVRDGCRAAPAAVASTAFADVAEAVETVAFSAVPAAVTGLSAIRSMLMDVPGVNCAAPAAVARTAVDGGGGRGGDGRVLRGAGRGRGRGVPAGCRGVVDDQGYRVDRVDVAVPAFALPYTRTRRVASWRVGDAGEVGGGTLVVLVRRGAGLGGADLRRGRCCPTARTWRAACAAFDWNR